MSLVLPTFSGFVQPASGGAFANTLAGSFDGSDDRLTIGSGLESVINSASTLSVSAWFKLSANSGAIFSSGTSGTNGFWLYPYDNSYFLFTVRNGGGEFLSVTPPSLNTWHHVCGVLNGSNSVLYIDGSVAATGTLPALGSSGGDSPSIGSFHNTAGFINGLVDEVAIFSSALSATDVWDIYNGGVPNDLGRDGLNLSPVGWWRLGDGTGDTDSGGGAPADTDTIGTVVNQGSASSADATAVSAPTYSNDRPYALPSIMNTLGGSFDGSDDYLDCGTVTAMNGASSFTLSGWFKFDADNTLFWTGGVDAGDRFAFYLKSGGSLGVYLGSAEILTSASTLSTGQYYHIAVVKDGNGTSDSTLYINGSSSDTGGLNASMPSSAGQNFWIGASQVFSGYEMQGKADELAFWSTALTSSDITAIYNSGVPADLSSLNPVHWWRIGDGTGDTNSGGGTPASGDTIGTVEDQGDPGGNNATVGGAPTYSNDVPS